MAFARSFVRWVPVAVVALAVVLLGGCATSGGGCSNWTGGTSCDYTAPICGPSCHGCGPAAPPFDLPKDPAPCLKYCRVWVPPVYRDVPRLEPVCGGPRQVDKVVDEVCFKTVCTPGKRYGCVTPGRDCEAVAVQVCPGGYRWQQVEDGCWRYCECNPTYKWCKKQVHEDGIAYCANEPPTYETVAVRTERRICDTVYEPSTYRTVWCKELYQPGRWEWVLKNDCSPEPCGDCCCEPLTYDMGTTCTRGAAVSPPCVCTR
jgi:hypothetical protein